MATAQLNKPEKIFLCRVATNQVLPDVYVKILFKLNQLNPLVRKVPAGFLLPEQFTRGFFMKTKLYTLITIFMLVCTFEVSAVTQQLGARGKINRMIVNHNANNNEIFISTTDAAPLCPEITLRTNDPNVTSLSYKTLYSYLLAAKLTDKTLEFYTDLSCNLFRLEIV